LLSAEYPAQGGQKRSGRFRMATVTPAHCVKPGDFSGRARLGSESMIGEELRAVVIEVGAALLRRAAYA
jgi:hypothetical protein